MPHLQIEVYKVDNEDLIRVIIMEFSFFYNHLEQLQEKMKTEVVHVTLEFYDLELPTWQHGVSAMFFSVVAQINIPSKVYSRKRKSLVPLHSSLPCSAPLFTYPPHHNTWVIKQQVRIKLIEVIEGISLSLRPFSLFFLSQKFSLTPFSTCESLTSYATLPRDTGRFGLSYIRWVLGHSAISSANR